MKCVMDHIGLNVEDAERMIGFYAVVLRLVPVRLDEYREGKVPFPSVRLNRDTVIDFYPPDLWRGAEESIVRPGSLSHFCISLIREEWADLLARLRTHGTEIEQGPTPRWGAHGTGTSFYVRDPEGNLVEVRQYGDNDQSEECLLRS